MLAPLTRRTVTRPWPAATRLRAQACSCRRHAEGIGDVTLQGDAGAYRFEPRPVERPHKRFGGERHVPVFLHVQVDEFGHHPPFGRVKRARAAAPTRRSSRSHKIRTVASRASDEICE